MVFRGNTADELARQPKAPRLNGGKTLERLILHVSDDRLVNGLRQAR